MTQLNYSWVCSQWTLSQHRDIRRVFFYIKDLFIFTFLCVYLHKFMSTTWLQRPAEVKRRYQILWPGCWGPDPL